MERGEHVEVWASPSIEVCGGNVDHMDRFVDRFRELVGPRPEAEDLHRFYVLDEQDWDDLGICQPDACSVRRRTIYSRFLPSTHELVHAEISAGGYTLLEEGLAEVFGEARPDELPFAHDIDEVIGQGDSGLPGGAYQRAAHFTRFLIDRHGLDGFLALRDATRRGDGVPQLERAFDETLGVSLDAELLAYGDYPEFCWNPGYRFPLLECETPPTPWASPTEFVETVDLTCANDDVMGPRWGELFTLRSFEVGELDKFAIEVEAPGSDYASAWVVKCDAECASLPRDDHEHPWEPAQIVVEAHPQEPAEALLYPGKYWVQLARPVDQPGDVTLRIASVTQ